MIEKKRISKLIFVSFMILIGFFYDIPSEASKTKHQPSKAKTPTNTIKKKVTSTPNSSINRTHQTPTKQFNQGSSSNKSVKSVSNLNPKASPKPEHPKLLGIYGQWHAYETRESGKKVCYMTSIPEKQSGNYAKRGEVYMVLAHRPSLKSFDVVSFDAGYLYKKGTQLDVQVSGNNISKFKLFTEKETAWCADSLTDKKLAEAFIKGSQITVVGESEKGTKTEDTYSLNGSTAAYTAICKACEVKRG